MYAAQDTRIDSAEKEENPYTWDFGQVKEGGVLTHKFTLRNESAKILNIKDVSTSCGCTASEVKKKLLLPQEETEIEVKFNTKGYAGPTKQFVYLNTDSIEQPIIKLIIKAEIIK